MSKELTPLEAWEEANENAYDYGCEISGDLCYIIETALKALEIIKEKQVNVELLMKTESANDYNKYSKDVNQSHNLGQRQYELLKEVLL